MLYNGAPAGFAKPGNMDSAAIAALAVSTVVICLSGWYLPAGLELSLQQAAALVTGG